MTPFFNSPERIEQLRAEISSWIGTPFFPNVAIKGRGVSCQKFVGSVLQACGALPSDLTIPAAPMRWARTHKDSLVVREVEARPEFQTIYDRSENPSVGVHAPQRISGLSTFLPGDLLGLKWGGCVQHLAIVFDEFVAIHVLRGHSVSQMSLTDATMLSHLEKAWRPIEL